MFDVSQLQLKLHQDLYDFRTKMFKLKKKYFNEKKMWTEDSSEVSKIIKKMKINLNEELSYLSLSLIQKSNFE